MERMGGEVMWELWGWECDKVKEMDFIEKRFVNGGLK